MHGRRRIQHEGFAVSRSELGPVLDRGERHFELREHDVGFRERLLRHVEIGRAQPRIGARHHDDGVVGVAHSDRRDSGRHARGFVDPVRGHGFGGEARFELSAERVGAHPAEHGDICAEPRRRHGLIRPLAAGMRRKARSRQSLPEPRKRARFHHEIHVDTAEYQHPGH